MTAAKRIVTVGLAALAVFAGSERRPIEARIGDATPAGLPASKPSPPCQWPSWPRGPPAGAAVRKPGRDAGLSGRAVFRGRRWLEWPRTLAPRRGGRSNDGRGHRRRARKFVAEPAHRRRRSVVLHSLDARSRRRALAVRRYQPAFTCGRCQSRAGERGFRHLTAYGNKLVFGGNNGVNGDELYTFDPTNGLKSFDICPDRLRVRSLRVHRP